MCDVLREVYNEVFDELFYYNNFEQRIKLQKCVYLLENMGIHVGNYSFVWDKYGPYSIALDDDAYRCSQKAEKREVVFTEEAKKAFEKIKRIISKQCVYKDDKWLECISSLHFLKYILHISNDDSEVLKKLVEKKPHLNNNEQNKNAMYIANEIEKSM